MRFVSPHRGYELTLRNESIGGYTPQGEPIYTNQRLKAFFQQGGLSPWEIDKALETFTFQGIAEGVDPRSRLSWFDTEWAQRELGWTDEEREFVEQKMLNLAGRHGVDYIFVDQPRQEAPWPNYDKVSSPGKIVDTVTELGLDIETVLHYERENHNRADVIEALVAARDNTRSDAEVVVPA